MSTLCQNLITDLIEDCYAGTLQLQRALWIQAQAFPDMEIEITMQRSVSTIKPSIVVYIEEW
jgi:hypothetical protein